MANTALIQRHKKRGDTLFEKKLAAHSLWQTIAENFYPERSDFVTERRIGNELADNLMDSYPVLVRRDLGNSLHAMLRDGDWFEMGLGSGMKADYRSNIWLQSRTRALRQMMNDRSSGFIRSAKQCDHDYVTFGQGVISTELNRKANGLLYRNWHLRDCAWFDDDAGNVGGVYRQARPELHQLVATFGEDRLHPKLREKHKKNPFDHARIYHLVIPSEMYGDDELASKYPYVSCYVDIENEVCIEERGLNHRMYTIPRFQTVACSPYAYSPATVVALPDARTLQAMTFTLMEAAERYARPPIIATQRAIRSDVNLGPDEVTWVDEEYDERMGAALRTLPQDRGGWPVGDAMRERITDVINQAFYLNKVMLPDVSHEMTAYEVAERMKEFRRQNLPLFAPIEAEYNGQICEISFQIALEAGLLGSPYDIPQGLRGAGIEFKFKSPLSESEEEKKVNRFHTMAQLLSEAATFDQMAGHNVDFDTAFREAVMGSGIEQHWLHSPEDVQQRRMVEQTVNAAETTVAQEALVQ